MKVNPWDTMHKLMGQPVTIRMTSQINDSATGQNLNLEVKGILRGFEDNWLVIQELPNQEQADEMTLVRTQNIHSIRKSLQI